MTGELDRVRATLHADEILTPDSPEYTNESKTWAVQKNLRPRLVARPKSIESLCSLVSALNGTTLDVAVRSQGFGSSSAKDVLISMTAFDGFEYNLDDETVTFGTGQNWSRVDENIDTFCPGYATVSVRSGYLGVGGSLVHGGLSWVSSERGIAVRPENLLDAQVVKADGTAVWASSDPDLLWCIRGGGHSFGIVTAVKMKIFKYPRNIFTGRLIYPRSALHYIAREVAAFTRRVSDPKLCLHLYCLVAEESDAAKEDATVGSNKEDMTKNTDSGQISLWIYDAHGEEHARSAEGFAWAFQVEGAVDNTLSLSLSEVNNLGSKSTLINDARIVLTYFEEELATISGLTDSWMSAPLISDISEDLILRAWEWFEETLAANPAVKQVSMGIFVLIEMMQKVG